MHRSDFGALGASVPDDVGELELDASDGDYLTYRQLRALGVSVFSSLLLLTMGVSFEDVAELVRIGIPPELVTDILL
jgi:hypothetical protein